ncbi:MAG: hypothetical protein ACFNZD_00865 [Candidatus Nanoperiomorbus sp.]
MKREGGYTVLETGLAIAMSTTLVLLTFGLAAMVGRGRFRDSLVSAQTFVKQQYSEVRSSINSRLVDGNSTNQALVSSCNNATVPGNSAQCYVMGRLIEFYNDVNTGQIKSSYVVATMDEVTAKAWPDRNKSALDNLKNGNVKLYALTNDNGNDAGLNPSIKSIGADNRIVKSWQLDVSSKQATNIQPNILKANMIILRSPLDGSLVVAPMVSISNNNLPQGVMKVDLSSVNGGMSINTKLALAIRNGGLGYPGGTLCISGGDSSSGISNNFNVAGGNWNWDNGLKSVVASDVIDACKNWGQQ